MTYFMLDCQEPADLTARDILAYPEIAGVETWYAGARFAIAPTGPIVLQWDPDTEGDRKSYYHGTIPLMRVELLEALGAAGIDNLDTYEVAIQDSQTGVVDRDYRAANVIGVVSAANLQHSIYADPSGRRRIDMDFDSLAISASATRGALLFRLAECVSGLVVHHEIRRRLEAVGGFGLTFVEPEQWVG